MNKRIFFCLLILLIPAVVIAGDQKKDLDQAPIDDIELKLSFFESVKIIDDYVKENDLYFKGMHLNSVSLRYMGLP